MFRRLANAIPVTDCLNEIKANPVLWDLFTLRQNTPGSPHRDTQCIILRGPAIPDVEAAFNDLQAYDYPVIYRLPETIALLKHVTMQHLQGYNLGRVMVARLNPGGHIERHADEGPYAEHYERFHLILESADGNRFANGMAQVRMQPGTLWSFNHRAPHEVWNESKEPRIHIIIDARKTGIE